MNVIDLRTTDERMAPLDFNLSVTELADAKVYQAQVVRQRDDLSAVERAIEAREPRPVREGWVSEIFNSSGWLP